MNFYEECARLLGTTYECEGFPFSKRTRWNNRKAGNGRFPGFGIIRVFGNNVHVALNNPVIHHKIYKSQQEVLEFLESLSISKR